MTQKEQKIDKVDKEKIELVEMAIVDKAQLIMQRASFGDFVEIERRGQTIEQIAKEAQSDVYAVITYRRIMGKAVIEGKAIDISSNNFDFSPTTYIDGQIMSINEVKKIMPNSDILVSNMEDAGLRRVIKTRTGSVIQYMEGDRNISLRKKG